MVGARWEEGRRVALAIALAAAILLLGAREAGAAKYSVAQCGWYLGADASWADTTGGVKFRPDAYCVKPPGTDPFDGAHMKSFTRNEPTVSGTRFARWRWDAPPGTAITRISGTWWQTLHDGIEQRIGGVGSGGFQPFAIAAATNVAPRAFVAGFNPPVAAIEDRLLCARAEHKHCSLSPASWSAVRALTITLEDNSPPAAGLGGELFAGHWRKGSQAYGFWVGELGGGVRYSDGCIPVNVCLHSPEAFTFGSTELEIHFEILRVVSSDCIQSTRPVPHHLVALHPARNLYAHCSLYSNNYISTNLSYCLQKTENSFPAFFSGFLACFE